MPAKVAPGPAKVAPGPAKVALVTGAARRIGAAIAEQLHISGMSIALHYNQSTEDARALCKKFNVRRPRSARAFQADLCAPGSIPTLVDSVAKSFARLDVLVNNASSYYATPIASASETEWDDLIGTNLKAPFFLAKHCAPMLQESGGCIVNLTDIHGSKPSRGYPIYCAAKAGLAMLTQAMAQELSPGVRVNAIAPGVILWPEDGAAEDDRASILDRVLLGRSGTPGDIAATVKFLVYDAPYLTGQCITVDGGKSIG